MTEKMLYRIIAQKEKITITANTTETTEAEATQTAMVELIGGLDEAIHFRPYVLLPLTTKERWDEGNINFCPRCGTNIADMELQNYDRFECNECEAILNIDIEVHIEEEEDDDDDTIGTADEGGY